MKTMGIFKHDGPLMLLLGKIGDLVILNALTMLFCIPIVTIGASLTACHYTALKTCRGEGYVVRNFWKSFKENFKQSTGIFLFLIAFGGISALFIWVLSVNQLGMPGMVVQGFLTVCVIFSLAIGVWVFPIQAKFINPILQTIMRAFMMACRYALRTIAMILLTCMPVVLIFILPYQWYSVLLLFGFSLPTYLSAKMYDKLFGTIEDKLQPAEESDLQ